MYTDSFKKDWTVLTVAFATLISGLFSIFQILFIKFPNLLKMEPFIVSFGLYHFSRILTLLSGFVFIYLSFELLERKKVAWLLAVIFSTIGIFVHIVKRDDIYSCFIPLAILFLLFIFRKRFTVIGGPVTLRKGVKISIFILSIAIAYGVIGFFILDIKDFGVKFKFWELFY